MSGDEQREGSEDETPKSYESPDYETLGGVVAIAQIFAEMESYDSSNGGTAMLGDGSS